MSSHRLYAGRQFLGRQYLPSLFTGVGTFAPPVVTAVVQFDVQFAYVQPQAPQFAYVQMQAPKFAGR